jgi:hypothetical protein
MIFSNCASLVYQDIHFIFYMEDSFKNKFRLSMGLDCLLKYFTFICISLYWQLFDIHSSGLLAEIHTGHHSTIQYCDFSPCNHLAVVALSQYCVEVSRWIYSLKSGFSRDPRMIENGFLNLFLLRMLPWEIIEYFLHTLIIFNFGILNYIASFIILTVTEDLI